MDGTGEAVDAPPTVAAVVGWTMKSTQAASASAERSKAPRVASRQVRCSGLHDGAGEAPAAAVCSMSSAARRSSVWRSSGEALLRPTSAPGPAARSTACFTALTCSASRAAGMSRERAREEPEGVADPLVGPVDAGAAPDEMTPAGEEVEEAPASPFPAHPARARALAATTPSRDRRRAVVRGVVMTEL